MSEESQLDLNNLLARLSAPFPSEAYETDDSRGFTLTGIKGAYVIERLNQELGLCGTGWCFSVSAMEVTEKFVLADIEFQYHVNGEWSKPIPISGDQMIVRGRVGDAKKGAITDAIKKGAGLLGVGNEAYKGLLSSPVNRTSLSRPHTEKTQHWIDNERARMAFWAFTKGTLKLTKAKVYQALGVEHIHDYAGTMKDAKATLEDYAFAKSEAHQTEI